MFDEIDIGIGGRAAEAGGQKLKALSRAQQVLCVTHLPQIAAFADQHRSGILSEQLTVNSLVETLAVNVPGVQRVNILVEGQTRETLAGHADLSEAFDAAAVMQASQ